MNYLELIETFKPLYEDAKKESKIWQDAFIKAICLHEEIIITEFNLHYKWDNSKKEYIDFNSDGDKNE